MIVFSLSFNKVKYQKTKHGFELSAIPQKTNDVFSNGSRNIEAYLKEHRLRDTPQNKAKAALLTRKENGTGDRAALQEEWREKAEKHGVTPERIRELQRKDFKELSELEVSQKQQQTLKEALEKCLYHDSVFTEYDLEQAIRAIGSY